MRAEPEPEPKREKLSLRMELKRKRQGGEVPSGQDDNSAPPSVAVGKHLSLHLSTSDIHSVFGYFLRTVHQTDGSVCLRLTFVLPVQFRKIYLEQMRAQAWQHSYPLEMVWNPRLICHKG